jgi:spermidine synthase
LLSLCLIFFLSGASALLFETLWFRLAGLSFGNSVWASSLVLAAFMAGLAIGNLLAGWLGPRFRRPLLVYAAIEILIGVTGFGLILLFPVLTPILSPLFRQFLENPSVLNPLRLLIAFALLLIPATAMGATLPLLVKTLSAREPNFGRVLGRLYGWNTSGAVLGALSGEIVFVGTLGLRGTGLLAASMNIVAALCAFALARRFSDEMELKTVEPRNLTGWLDGKAKWLLTAAFLSGAILLGLEVVWFRFLLLFVHGSTMAFALMLSVILLAIAAGGFIASWWLKFRPDAYRLLPFLAVACGASAALTYIAFDDGFGLYSAAPMKPVGEPLTVFLLAMGLTLPASLISGMIFTFVGRSLQEEVPNKTRAAAGVTFANTVGAMLGPLIAGFVLIPSLGMEVAFFLLAAAYMGVAVAGLAAGSRDNPRSRRESMVLGFAGALFAVLLVLFPFGLMQNHYFPQIIRIHMQEGSKMVAMREGLTETSFYLEKDLYGEPLYYTLVTDSFSMSGTAFTSRRYMKLFAYWVGALHPSPKRALVISYGVGNTAKALTDIESLESIDVVDISRGLLELSQEVPLFPHDHPLNDPRTRVHIEDGRFFLQTTDIEFDLITGEPPPPKHAGVVNLYSREYFQLLFDRLAPGGAATYWLPVYQLSPRETRSIVKAFCMAFSDCSLWSAAGLEWILAGSRDLHGPVAEPEFRRLWKDPPLRAELQAIGVEVPEQLGALFIGDADLLTEWTRDTPPLEDNYPRRISPNIVFEQEEYTRALAEYRGLMDVRETEQRFRQSDFIRRTWPTTIREATLDYFGAQELWNLYFQQRSGIPEIYQALTSSSLRSLPIVMMGNDPDYRPKLERILEAGTADPGVEYLLGTLCLGDRRYSDAVQHFDRALSLDQRSITLARYRLLALLLAGDRNAAENTARVLRAWEPPAQDPHFWNWVDTTLAEPNGPASSQVSSSSQR